MTMPSPFELASQTTRNFGDAFGKANENIRDKSALDEIFEQVASSNDPQAYDKALLSILKNVSPERRSDAANLLTNKYKRDETERFNQQVQRRRMNERNPDIQSSNAPVNQNIAPNQPQEQQPQNMSAQQEIPEPEFYGENLVDYTPEERIKLQALDPKRSEIVEKQIEQQEKRRLAEQKYSQSELKPLKDEIRTLKKELPNTEIALQMAENAIEGSESWDGLAEFLASSTGIENFRTRKGAELQSAIKQYFLGDLSSIKGGRPNMLIERQLLDAYPKMGRDPISNRIILLGLKAKEEIAKAKVSQFSRLEDKYLGNGKPLPSNVEYMVNKKLEPLAEKIQNRTLTAMNHLNKVGERAYKKAREGLKKGEILMLDDQGQVFAVEGKEQDDYSQKGWVRI